MVVLRLEDKGSSGNDIPNAPGFYTNAGAAMIRIGFGGTLYYIVLLRTPQNRILTIEAPTLLCENTLSERKGKLRPSWHNRFETRVSEFRG